MRELRKVKEILIGIKDLKFFLESLLEIREIIYIFGIFCCGSFGLDLVIGVVMICIVILSNYWKI